MQVSYSRCLPHLAENVFFSPRCCVREFKPGAVTAIAKFEGDPRVSNSAGEAASIFPGAAEILRVLLLRRCIYARGLDT